MRCHGLLELLTVNPRFAQSDFKGQDFPGVWGAHIVVAAEEEPAAIAVRHA